MADIIVAVAAGILGLVSAVLGFAAEATKIHPYEVYDFTYYGLGCARPKSPAFALALVAALLLLITQILLNVFTGCCGCCKTDKSLPTVSNVSNVSNVLAFQAGNKRTPAIIMIVVSWVTFVTSFILFVVGAIINTPGGRVNSICTSVAPGVFAMASIFSLITVGLGIGAYFLFQKASDAGILTSNPGIAMATPQQYPQVVGQVQFQQPGIVQGTPQPGAQPEFYKGPPPTSQGTTQSQTQQQNYYPPPGSMPAGYGYNTQTNM